ncbi:UNVERIFIED_CONTAM: hypothetical protein GTU68_058993 [Idotea baltica]|nr:hypothetical protein [Idotea baltica]
MATFQDLNLNTPLYNALDDLGFTTPTPIQAEAFNVISSGKDVVGIAQTGTGKTYAYMLPVLKTLKFSTQETPRILVLVPTRELVVQVVDEIEKLTKYINTRVLGVYGGTNINTQKRAIADGIDILVATPGRLYDLALSRVLQLKSIQKLIIDEVDVMLDLGFKHQLINIFDILPEKRQNIMFSATMTQDVNVMARGLDIDNVSHVINFDTPDFPENYMHRIGRTGRAEREGKAMVFSTPKDQDSIDTIESLMKMTIPVVDMPETIEISTELIEEERPQIKEHNNPHKRKDEDAPGPAFHEKSEKNSKENLGGSYKFKIAAKYKKPKTKGDKNYNRRNKDFKK